MYPGYFDASSPFLQGSYAFQLCSSWLAETLILHFLIKGEGLKICDMFATNLQGTPVRERS